jgi:murein DD-endopeptidase MepM/ murein hydrolase activator NlpD
MNCPCQERTTIIVLVYRNRWIGIGWLVISLVLGACSQDLAAQTDVPTQPPSPTVDQLATLIAMQQYATDVPTATPWPTATSAATPTPTSPPTETLTPAPTLIATDTTTPEPTSIPPTATPQLFPTNTPRGTPVIVQTIAPTTPAPTAVAALTFDQTGERRDHYWMDRPFPRDPSNQIKDFASRNYPYGTSGDGGLQTHYGMDMQNLQGTGILAVADGWVMYAGDDSEVKFGPQNDFYGNLVVIAHDRLAPDGQTVYTLYGHMFRVAVESGQRVERGDNIGQVGSTGVALGAHLHLEVRIGDMYDYGSTYNPDLWLLPWPGYGTLAGRVYDSDGTRLYNVPIIIQSADGVPRQTWSYADEGVNPDPYYQEHYTYGDLPMGSYEVLVRIRGVLRFKGEVTVEGGKTSWLDIRLE